MSQGEEGSLDGPTGSADDRPKEETPPPSVDKSPSSVYQLTATMEEISDKLRMLRYDEEMGKARKPLTQHYFATPTNPGEQFPAFTTVAAWLIRKCGVATMEMPQEGDDPNAILSGILNHMRQLSIRVDFAPAKLKSGAGEQVVYALEMLSELALTTTAWQWRPMTMTREEVEGEGATMDIDEQEVTVEQFEEDDEVAMADDDDEGGEYFDLQHEPASANAVKEESRAMLRQPTDNAAEWAREVERVVPSLKIVIRHDAKDWRSHVEQMQSHHSAMGETLTTARTQLGRLADDINKSLDNISSREKYLNSQLSGVLDSFRRSQDTFAETKQKYKEASGGVTERQRRLGELTEEMDGLKQRMEERGANLTDGAPLVKLKQSMTRLQTELVEMDVVVGVIEQSLLQAQLRDTNMMHMAHTDVQHIIWYNKYSVHTLHDLLLCRFAVDQDGEFVYRYPNRVLHRYVRCIYVMEHQSIGL